MTIAKNQPVGKPEKKDYEKPLVTTFGNVRTITQAVNKNTVSDGGTGVNKKTA